MIHLIDQHASLIELEQSPVLHSPSKPRDPHEVQLLQRKLNAGVGLVVVGPPQCSLQPLLLAILCNNKDAASNSVEAHNESSG